jgi:hypothetical protein
LRLEVAAQLAFPDGSITASALRRLAAHGKLDHEKIAGKIYVTLASIEEMRNRCRVSAGDQGLNSNTIKTAHPNGLSETANVPLALDAMNATATAEGKLAEYIIKKHDPAKPSTNNAIRQK